MKKLPVLLFMISSLACNHAVADDNDFRCLVSVGLKKPLRLQFVFSSDDRGTGYVIYQTGSGPIQIKKKASKTVREVGNGRPWVFETEWEEVIANGAGGKYLVVTQGAQIYELKYIRKKDGKTFKFEEDLEASGETGCEWNTKSPG